MKIFKKKVFYLLGIILLGALCLTVKYDAEKYFIEVSNKVLTQLLDSEEDFILYIGRPTCSTCEELTPILKKQVKELRQVVYYYNTDNARQENNEEMTELIGALDVKLVPTILYLNNGTIDEKKEGIQTEDELKQFLEMNRVEE